MKILNDVHVVLADSTTAKINAILDEVLILIANLTGTIPEPRQPDGGTSIISDKERAGKNA